MATESLTRATVKKTRGGGLFKRIVKHRWYYLMLIPGLIWVFLFHYLPISNLAIAFQDFKIFKGIGGSEWVGFAHFKTLFASRVFYKLLGNTVILSFANLFIGFPFAIILALMINEVSHSFIKRSVQTIVYLPHFMSWVVVAAIANTVFSLSYGAINNVIRALGGEAVFFLGRTDLFRQVLVGVNVWKESGWNAVLYLAALAGVPVELYEAASVDGASRFQKMIHISIPAILPTISITLLLRIGRILNMGFEQVLAMYNPAVYDVADILDTYVYRVGLVEQNYSFSTAVGLFKSVVSFILVLGSNRLARALGQESLF